MDSHLIPLSQFNVAETTFEKHVVMDDANAVQRWLAFIELRNKLTARSYQKEVVRFAIFLETLHEKSQGHAQQFLLRDASEMDVALYEAYLGGRTRVGDPVVPLSVPAYILSRYGKKNEPFLNKEGKALSLKASSVNQAMSILHALYEHWLNPDPQTKIAYVGANPVKRIKRASVRAQRQTDRCFPANAVQAMLMSAQHLADNAHNDTRRALFIRRRWIAAMLFGLWGRRAEMARVAMGDFSRSAHGGWQVNLLRKGGREQTVPVASWVITELVRYRESLGMTPLPLPDEDAACIQRLRLNTASKTVNPDLIYREVCALAKDAAQTLRDDEITLDLDPLERESLAQRLTQVSPHWFRHSGATLAINSGAMSLENASKMLGHSSPDVTSTMYHHADDIAMEQGIEKIGNGLFQSVLAY